MKMFSKKQLIPFLLEGGFIHTEKSVSYEAYGRKVCAYVSVVDMNMRAKLESALKVAGQHVSDSYWPGHAVVCTDVTYFKAYGWED